MFFKRSLEYIKNSLQKQEEDQKELQKELQGTLKLLLESSRELQRDFRRQMNSFEDFIEEIQEQETGADREQSEQEKAAKKEMLLAEAAVLCMQQLSLLEKSFSAMETGVFTEEQKAGWEGQLALMRQERCQRCSLAGLTELGVKEDSFDYQIYEALGTIETPEKEREGKLAEVISSGFAYHGKVLKKAQVLVYKTKEEA